MSENGDVIVLFPIYGHFAVFWKQDSRIMVYKTYIFINNKLGTYKTCKQNSKFSNTASILLL